MSNNFIKEFRLRGFYHQCTDENSLNRLMQKPIKAYIGFDITADSLHVGSLLQIMCLRLLQKHGHQPIILLGSGTTLIGDPSGKDKTRKILDKKQISKNSKKIQKLFLKLLDFKNKKTKPLFVDNSKWLEKLNYINFLRDIGKHFTINRMLTFDSVKLRLEREQSLSYMEFNYMILQAYDFLKLHEKNSCILQIGGSDQWGNIVNGVELIRKVNQKEAYGLTTPLITLSSGQKMGKTETGAVWLDRDLLSPYDYWQFWRNTPDNDVERFLKLFTDLEIDKIENYKKTSNDINNLKILLANEATKIVHGKEESIKSEITAKKTFVDRSTGENLPEILFAKNKLEKGINIIEFLEEVKVLSSKSEARRLILNRGVKINNETIEDNNYFIKINNENFIKLSLGKKKHFKILPK